MESTSSRLRVAGILMLGVVGVAGCRMGLPPEPPGADATNAEAAIPEYQAPPDPFTRSAFEGETLDAGGGHQGHEGHAMPTSEEPSP